MMRFTVLICFFVAIVPSFVFAAGSQTFNTSGTFTVPSYGTVTVQAWGGGGGARCRNNNGTSGGASSFNASTAILANGGAGSTNTNGAGGAGGTASGGTTNTSGNPGQTVGPPTGIYRGGNGGSSPNGGAGGAGIPSIGTGGAGVVPGGGGGGCNAEGSWSGGGGAGGYSSRTYGAGELTTGGSVSVVVGSGGPGGSGGAAGTGGTGAAGRVVVTWTDPVPPTCSVTADVNPLGYGNATTLRWTSTSATTMYINSVGYVTANTSGSATVGPLSSTNYDGTAVGVSGTANCAFTLTVSAPATCTFNGSTVGHGSSVTGYQAATVPYGSSCVSETRTCSNGTLSGNYAFASCNVGPQCVVSLSPTSVTQGNSATLTWSSTNATSCTGDNFSTGGAAAGSVSVSPSQSTTYTATCTGAGGSAQCTGTGAGGIGTVLTLSCTPAYSCTGAGSQTITYTDAACTVTQGNTCVLPQFCSAGSSSCLIAAVTGSLSSSPILVGSGRTAQITWSSSNASACTVTGNGNTWIGTSGTQTSNVVTESTSYTLMCDDGDGDAVQDDYSRSIRLYRVPTWIER